eukprot:10454-Heterococcus_DN1.PRE.1
MVITAQEASSIHADQETPEEMAAAQLIDKVDKTIRVCSGQNMKQAYIIVPTWLPGLPIYDREAVRMQGEGFIVSWLKETAEATRQKNWEAEDRPRVVQTSKITRASTVSAVVPTTAPVGVVRTPLEDIATPSVVSKGSTIRLM